jgi:hypothetical protein
MKVISVIENEEVIGREVRCKVDVVRSQEGYSRNG